MARQVTLIALYGEKPALLSKLVFDCQQQITDILKSDFQPYDICQIHATIIDLSQIDAAAVRVNLNFAKYRQQEKQMNFAGVLKFIRENWLPMKVQIGGFENRDYPFVSRGKRPCDRSFSIQGDKVVILGWPICRQPSLNPVTLEENIIYPTVLEDFRRTNQNFNILHTYHREITDVDNDFYFRIGLARPAVPAEIKQKIENQIRQFLANIKPLAIEVTKSNLYLACYEDETLPINSTKFWSIEDPKVTPDFIENLYK